MVIDESQALDAFSALSQPARLQMVRTLMVAGPEGLPAGDVANAAGISPSSASFHLAHLERAGLVRSHREARSIIYSAHLEGLTAIVEFLMRDCCQGHPEICAPAALVANACCTPGATTNAC